MSLGLAMRSYEPKVRLYVPDQAYMGGAVLSLDQRATHYLRNVLRLTVGDEITVFDGKNGAWRAVITALGKKVGEVQLEEQGAEQERPPDLWLLFAPIKRDRIDFLVEKATELGVSRILPVLTKRVQVERVKLERLQAHAIEASEQCGRTFVPSVMMPQRLDKLLDQWPQDRHLLYCDEMKAAAHVAKPVLPQGPWAILVGPEGGFDESERVRLGALPQSHPIALGPRILRADTAALAAITYWQMQLGDW